MTAAADNKTGDSVPSSSPTPTVVYDGESGEAKGQTDDDLAPPPDGGFNAWSTVAGAFLAVFVQFGLANSFGVFQSYYKDNQLSQYTPSDISWIGGLQQFLLFFSGLFIGRLYDAHGPHVLMIPGSIAMVVSLMLTSLCKEYYQFALAQGVLFGIASGLVFHPAMASPGQWFAERRALALGAAVSGAGVGGTLWPIALKRMIDQIGFPWTIRAVGFISLGLLACSCALIRTRLPRTQPPPWSTLLAPCKEAPFVLLSLSVGVVYFGMFIPFFYITSYASLLGAESNLAFYCSSFINAGSVVGRLFAGIGDYLGAFNTLSITGCMSGLLVLVWWVPLNSVGALIGFGVLYGAFAGMYISIIMPCIAQLSTQHDFGSRVGLLWAIVSVFMLTGPSAGGALLGTDQAGYRHAGALSGAVVLGGSFLAIAARLCQDKRLRAII